jgi:hypothetical protein
MKSTLALFIVIASLPLSAADAPKPTEYLCYRTSDDQMTIDGKITEMEWKNAPWSSDFVNMAWPRVSTKPALRTRMKMLWSDTTLYIAAELQEPHVTAKMTQHDDDLYKENAFELFIDPDGDNQNYLELEINALNTVMDLTMDKPYRDRGAPDKSFELTGMKTAVHIDGTLNDNSNTDRGWTIEMAIPFAALKSISGVDRPKDAQQWRVNFARAEYVSESESHYTSWSPHGVVNTHLPECFGYVQFTTAAPGTGKFIPDPTASARQMLMELYHAEHNYHRKNHKYAGSIEAMKFDSHGQKIDLQTTPEGYVASTSAGEGNRVLSVNQDSRLWISEGRP